MRNRDTVRVQHIMRDHMGHPLSRREMVVRRLMCRVVGHNTVRAFGEFDEAQCVRCWATIAAPDVNAHAQS